MDSVLQLLDELEDVMDSSKAVPFSSKVTVNKEEIYDIISEIRMKLPNELKQSKWVIEERNKILIDAQREADEIRLNHYWQRFRRRCRRGLCNPRRFKRANDRRPYATASTRQPPRRYAINSPCLW